MTVLVDTNILLRAVDDSSAEHSVSAVALRRLSADGHDPVMCAQVMIEFWSVATRPKPSNGLGFDLAHAARLLDDFTRSIRVLPEPPDMAARWRHLITTYTVISKQSHDARLAAVVDAYGFRNLLTLNVGDFRRYAEVTCFPPADVVAGIAP
jgi:predicted nucleic acid-binding protein